MGVVPFAILNRLSLFLLLAVCSACKTVSLSSHLVQEPSLNDQKTPTLTIGEFERNSDGRMELIEEVPLEIIWNDAASKKQEVLPKSFLAFLSQKGGEGLEISPQGIGTILYPKKQKIAPGCYPFAFESQSGLLMMTRKYRDIAFVLDQMDFVKTIVAAGNLCFDQDSRIHRFDNNSLYSFSKYSNLNFLMLLEKWGATYRGDSLEQLGLIDAGKYSSDLAKKVRRRSRSLVRTGSRSFKKINFGSGIFTINSHKKNVGLLPSVVEESVDEVPPSQVKVVDESIDVVPPSKIEVVDENADLGSLVAEKAGKKIDISVPVTKKKVVETSESIFSRFIKKNFNSELLDRSIEQIGYEITVREVSGLRFVAIKESGFPDEIAELAYISKIEKGAFLSSKGEKYQVQAIGKGSYGEVFKIDFGSSHFENRSFAIKIINNFDKKLDRGLLINEILALKKANEIDPNYYIPFHGVMKMEDGRVGLVMDIADGSLQYGQRNIKPSNLADMAHSISLLHLNNIAHRDVKFDNFLVEEGLDDIKIRGADLATAAGEGLILKFNRGVIGSPSNMDPRLLRAYYKDENISLDIAKEDLKEFWFKSDVYAFAIDLLKYESTLGKGGNQPPSIKELYIKMLGENIEKYKDNNKIDFKEMEEEKYKKFFKDFQKGVEEKFSFAHFGEINDLSESQKTKLLNLLVQGLDPDWKTRISMTKLTEELKSILD